MKIQKTGLLIIILVSAMLACTLPTQGSTPIPVQFLDTPTVTISATQTSIPSITPVPTLVPIVRIKNADQAFVNGDWDAALVEYQAALNSDSDPEIRSAALLGIGRAYYQKNQFQESLQALEQLIQNFPESSQMGAAYYASALAYEALSRYQEAAEAYSRYLEIRPGLVDSYIFEQRGDALVMAGDYLGAIDAYQAAFSAPRVEDSLQVEIKIGNTYAIIGDYQTALVAYQDVYTRTTSDYTRAQLDYLIGQSYTALGQVESAYAAYLDAVENYPLSYDSYQTLILLVDSGYPVSEFDRGIVDYFAGQYNLSIAAFDRYLNVSMDNAGTVHYYKGLAYLALDNPGSAIASWDVVIQSYLADDYWDDAWEQKAYTQWAYLDQYAGSIQTLLDFVKGYPFHDRATEFLFDAARIAERSGDFKLAASIWERIPPEYPSSPFVSKSIFLAGISYYRVGDFSSALSTFEWFLGRSTNPVDKSAAYFWIAKTYQKMGNESGAQTFYGNAANEDPTGYYSERARDLLVGRAPFEPPVMFDLAFDAAVEKKDTETWMRSVFAIPNEIDLSGPGPLSGDQRFVRGTELWNLGLYEQARLEFESLRADILQNPMDNYRLANYLLDLGLYRSAIFAARQVLDLHGMNDAQTLTAPVYFNHVRFGSYYRELILPTAEAYGLHPLFLFSVVRQESLFEGFVNSSAGARGLMQIIPSTGASIVGNLGWPVGYSDDDLYRPKVNITLGADYLESQLNYFNGDVYGALAAYNAGPGNAAIWKDLAGGDMDLFLEIIRFEETQKYIKGIYEVF
ncbi:MAG: tetratricopeptide repeat protein, partial [Anaerolineales bacterium]|nr:tetratricopeptide repeat protein [Anaerolineales bacterium]